MFGRALGVGTLVVSRGESHSGGGDVGRRLGRRWWQRQLPVADVADGLVGVLLEVVPGSASRREFRPHDPRVLERVLLSARIEHSLVLETHEGLAVDTAGTDAARRRRLHTRGGGRGREGAVLVASVAALRRIVVRLVYIVCLPSRSRCSFIAGRCSRVRDFIGYCGRRTSEHRENKHTRLRSMRRHSS